MAGVDLASRIERAAEQAARAGLTGILAAPGPDLLYLTGYSPTAVTERITLLAVHPGREPVLVVPALERGDADRDGLRFVEWSDGEDPYAATAPVLEPGGRYAISDACWALHVLGLQQALPHSTYVSMTEALPLLRAVKEPGDVVVLDFGGLLDGYGSDITRTVHVGEPAGEHLRVHEVVREAQQAAFEAVRPGVACEDVDRAARAAIDAAGYGERFIHRTGHGIGITVHEPPYIVEGETQPLQPGMCFSIEPGVYLPGRFGVRVEDIVTVTEDGGRRLNAAPREMHVVR
jgi:Xaa-Pro aminopeptidase